jgi:hypothetical protein
VPLSGTAVANPSVATAPPASKIFLFDIESETSYTSGVTRLPSL